MALPHEAQRLGAAEALPAGREVRPGEFLVDRLVEADVDAAERVGDQREPQQADLGVVVDGDAGQVGHRLDQRFTARFGAAGLRLDRVHARFDEGVGGLQSGGAVHAVDLGLVRPGAAT